MAELAKEMGKICHDGVANLVPMDVSETNADISEPATTQEAANVDYLQKGLDVLRAMAKPEDLDADFPTAVGEWLIGRRAMRAREPRSRAEGD